MSVQTRNTGVGKCYWAVRLITLGLLVCLSLTAFGDTLTGKVVKITDGDTLYVLDANYKDHKIRLAGTTWRNV